jgi:two-component system LytT family response regulator
MIKALVIDDEKSSRDILEWQVAKHCPSVKIMASVSSSLDAVEVISKLEPQLVFLDIQMPEINGFELLEKLSPINFEVIFTTAFNEYAVKAFKYGAMDYLLKPIDMEELKTAVNKVEQKINEATKVSADLPPHPGKRMALTTSNSLIFIDPENIIYCEGKSNYTYFHLNTAEKKILISRTLKEIEEILVSFNFFRIHNSYLINMKYAKEYVRGSGGYVVMHNQAHLTVARSRKDEFFEFFMKF